MSAFVDGKAIQTYTREDLTPIVLPERISSCGALVEVEPHIGPLICDEVDGSSKSQKTSRLRQAARLKAPDITLIIIACFAFIAGYHIWHASIWYDEAITLLTTSGHANLDWALGLEQFKPSANFARILSDLYTQDVHPPLYFWALAMWRVIFGGSLEAARCLSALFMMGTLGLLYGVARDMRMRRPWIPMAILAASSAGTWYAYDARPYAMATLLIVLTQLLARKKSSWTGACAAASCATHYFAALCVLPILTVTWIARWKEEKRWVAVTAASFAACTAPLLFLLRVHMAARPHQYPSFGSFPVELWSLLKGAMQSGLPYTWLPGWGFILLVGAYFAVAGVWAALKARKCELPLLHGGFLCAFLLLTILTNKSITQMPAAYYLGLGAPSLALLTGLGVHTAPRGNLLLAVSIGVGLLAAKPIVKTEDYRQMVREFRAECPNCSIVVGKGYAGAAPACVLYEARGMPVALVNAGDSVDGILQRAGKQRPIFVIDTTEPPTAQVVDRFLQANPSGQKKGYFEVYGARSEGTLNAGMPKANSAGALRRIRRR